MRFRQEDHEESSFLRAIIANPADDLTRLVYADWLEERGEPRADYIRIQIELAKGVYQVSEFTRLTDRVAALYWKHHRYWNGQVYRRWIGTPLEGKGAHEGGLRGWQYRRGFPEILDVSAEFFVLHADLFLSVAPFQEVILRRLPQALDKFLSQHESVLKRLDKVVLPTNQLPAIPRGLVERVRIGARARQTIAEFRANG